MMDNDPQPLDMDASEGRPVTALELRNFVRQRAREAKLWAALDAGMDEALNLSKLISERRAELALLAARAAGIREAHAEASERARKIVEDAAAEAAIVGAQARGTLVDAERAGIEAREALELARNSAEAIIEDARKRAEEVAADVDRQLAARREDLKQLQAACDARQSELADSEKRLSSTKSALERIRKGLPE